MSCAGLVPVMAQAEQAGLSELVASKVAFTATTVPSAGVNPAGKVYAPATLGQFLREFTHGHGLQVASVARGHLVNLVTTTGLLPGIGQQAYVDIVSLLRPVFGHAKQGASFGHTKISGKQVLRRGLSRWSPPSPPTTVHR